MATTATQESLLRLDLSPDNMPSFIGMLSRLMHHTLVSSYQSKLLLMSHASHISRHQGDFVSCLASASTLSAGRQADRRMLAARSDLQLLASKIILNAMNKEDIKPACVFSCHICSLFCLQHLREEKKRKITPLGVITGASRPRGSPSLAFDPTCRPAFWSSSLPATDSLVSWYWPYIASSSVPACL